ALPAFISSSLNTGSDARFLGINPSSELDFGFFRRHGALGYTTLEVLVVEYALESQNGPDRIGRLSAFFDPVIGFHTIDVDGSRPGHRVVGSNALDKTAVSGCARICDNYVIQRRFSASVTL